VIHFNFGIPDRNTPIAEYTQRLKQLIDRMQKPGAKLVWANTTPIPDDLSKKQSAASIIERNSAAFELMNKRKIAIDDLFFRNHGASRGDAESKRCPLQYPGL
jgi:acyl-CoA thioesterase-1